MRDSVVAGLSAAVALVAFALCAQFYLAFHHHLSVGGAVVTVARRQQQQTNVSTAAAYAAPNATATRAAPNATATRAEPNSTTRSVPQQKVGEGRCAICLFGLPRAFESLVLPSLIENVLKVNARYNCDYFVHYYNVTYEPSSRSGAGGWIDPEEIRSLEAEVRRVSEASPVTPTSRRRPPVVTRFASETSDDFWRRRGELVNKVRMANDTEGRFLYFPWRETTYRHPTTTDNILKMWHSIQGSWDLMQSHSDATGVPYNRVAMLRSDVVYVTPIDIWGLPYGRFRDKNNTVAVIPGFCRYPVSDRLIYGPREAVKIWASERFDRMEDHVNWTLANNPGMGLHSETFVKRALLEPIQELGYRVEAHTTMCFVRARADESVWVKDCKQAALRSVAIRHNMTKVQARVEAILGRECHARPIPGEIDCPRNWTNTSLSDSSDPDPEVEESD